jgi:hypothetical protein
MTLGEPLRAPRALSHHGATRCASARSRRAIRYITRAAFHAVAGGFASIPLAANAQNKINNHTPQIDFSCIYKNWGKLVYISKSAVFIFKIKRSAER